MYPEEMGMFLITCMYPWKTQLAAKDSQTINSQSSMWAEITLDNDDNKRIEENNDGERESEGMGEGRRDGIGARVAWTLTVWSQSHLHYNSTVLMSLIHKYALSLPPSVLRNGGDILWSYCVLLSLRACMCATIFHLWVWTIELIEHCKQYCHMLSHPAVFPIYCRCVVTPSFTCAFACVDAVCSWS